VFPYVVYLPFAVWEGYILYSKKEKGLVPGLRLATTRQQRQTNDTNMGIRCAHPNRTQQAPCVRVGWISLQA